MKKTAFTLMEILIAMSIIGVLAVATMNNIGKAQANKTKEAFRNCYNHMEQTIASIMSDEVVYPHILCDKSVNATFCSNMLDSSGRTKIFPIRMFSYHDSTGVTSFMNSGGVSMMFPSLFVSRSAASDIVVDKTASCYECMLKNGSYWAICHKSSQNTGNITDISKADFTITFDVNGRNNGTNCPYSGSSLSTGPTNCAKPDTFKFGLTYDNKIIPDNNTVYNGVKLGTFMTEYGYGDTTNSSSGSSSF